MHRSLVVLMLLMAGGLHAEPRPDEGDPIMASVIFYSQSYAIERIQEWCRSEHPSSAASIDAARKDWDRVHRPLWDRVPGILKSKLSREERLAIAVQARRDNDAIVARLASAPRDERVSWCVEAPARIRSEELSLMGRSRLVRAITTY